MSWNWEEIAVSLGNSKCFITCPTEGTAPHPSRHSDSCDVPHRCFMQDSISPTSSLSRASPTVLGVSPFLRLKLHHLPFSEADIPSLNPNSALSRLFEGPSFLNYTRVGCSKGPQGTLPVLSREMQAVKLADLFFTWQSCPPLHENRRFPASLLEAARFDLCGQRPPPCAQLSWRLNSAFCTWSVARGEPPQTLAVHDSRLLSPSAPRVQLPWAGEGIGERAQ